MKVPLKTCEIRWFLPDSRMMSVRKMFDALASPARKQPVREDWYFRLQHSDMGIKAREGSIDVKRRSEDLAIPVKGAMTGHIYQYAKWSFPVSDSDNIEEQMNVNDWIPVQKDRSIKLFGFEKDGRLSPWYSEEWPPAGSQIEMTILPLQPDFITFGIDGFGDDKNTRIAALEAAINLLKPLADSTQVQFAAEKCRDYPEWLSSL